MKIPWGLSKQIPCYLRDMYRVKRGKRPKKALDTVLHITMNCNLRCEYCYIARDKKLFPNKYKESGLPQEDIKKILDNIKRNSMTVTFFGGEPFVRKDLTELVRYAKEEIRMPMVNITTNGTLLKEKKNALQYIDMLGVSYDQTRMHQYPKKMKTMLMDLEELSRAGQTKNVTFDVTMKHDDHVDELFPFFEYCKHNDFKVFLQPVRYDNNVYEWKAYKKQFKTIFERYGDSMITNNDRVVTNLDANYIRENCIPNIKYIIDVNGQLIYPCERFSHQKVGSTIFEDIGQLYDRAEKQLGSFPNKTCGDCGMQCYTEVGTIYQKPTFLLSKAYHQIFKK